MLTVYRLEGKKFKGFIVGNITVVGTMIKPLGKFIMDILNFKQNIFRDNKSFVYTNYTITFVYTLVHVEYI